MVSSVPTILRSQVRIPITPFTLISICIIEMRKGRNKQKRPGWAHLKKAAYIKTDYFYQSRHPNHRGGNSCIPGSSRCGRRISNHQIRSMGKNGSRVPLDRFKNQSTCADLHDSTASSARCSQTSSAKWLLAGRRANA